MHVKRLVQFLVYRSVNKHIVPQQLCWNVYRCSFSSTSIPDVIERIQTSNSTEQLYDYFTSLSIPYLNDNNFITTIALSTVSSFKDVDATMNIYQYLLENDISRSNEFYHCLFDALSCIEYDDDNEDTLNLDLIHGIIKQMTADNIDLSVVHTDCILKLVQCHKNPSISNLNSLYELFVDKLAIRPSHTTFENMIIGCCKANCLMDAINYFEIAIHEFHDIPDVDTIKYLIQSINQHSNQKNPEDAVIKLETVINEMSDIYKNNDISQYNQFMNDSLIAFFCINCYFNNKQYIKCIEIYESIIKIDDGYIEDKRLNVIYYKSCIQLMEQSLLSNKKYVEDIINMEVNDDEDMKMLKFEGLSWISLHKPFDINISRDKINKLCSELSMDEKHFVYVDDVNMEKVIDLKFLASNEMKVCVILYFLESEVGDYIIKCNMNQDILLKPLLTQQYFNWSIKMDRTHNGIVLTHSKLIK